MLSDSVERCRDTIEQEGQNDPSYISHPTQSKTMSEEEDEDDRKKPNFEGQTVFKGDFREEDWPDE